MTFENRVYNTQTCERCMHPLTKQDLWCENIRRCEHGTMRSIRLKYECSVCGYYVPWYDMSALPEESCVRCIVKSNTDKEKERLKERPSYLSMVWHLKDNENSWIDPLLFKDKSQEESHVKDLRSDTYHIDVLTDSVNFHVQDSRCKGHWMYDHQCDAICVDCEIRECSCYGIKHCCCNNDSNINKK